MAKGSTKFSGIQGSIIGKYFLESLEYDLNIQHEINHIFITKATFTKYTEENEIYINLLKFCIPSEERRDKLCELLD